MTEMFLDLSPDTDKCDPELIRERIEDIEGYVASLRPGELFFENEETSLVLRTSVEESDDGDGVNHRMVDVVREEEGNDKKEWLVTAKGGCIFTVHELVDKDHNNDRRGAYLLFSSKVDPIQFADCSNCDSLEQLADSLALVSGINRPSRNPFAVEKNSQ